MGGFLLRYFPGSTCRCHWLFSPGSEGSEGISSLALSPNRKFLAVTRRWNKRAQWGMAKTIAKLVYNSNNYGLWWFMVLITIVIGAYKPTNITLFVGSWLLDYLGFQKRGRERERESNIPDIRWQNDEHDWFCEADRSTFFLTKSITPKKLQSILATLRFNNLLLGLRQIYGEWFRWV